MCVSLVVFRSVSHCVCVSLIVCVSFCVFVCVSFCVCVSECHLCLWVSLFVSHCVWGCVLWVRVSHRVCVIVCLCGIACVRVALRVCVHHCVCLLLCGCLLLGVCVSLCLCVWAYTCGGCQFDLKTIAGTCVVYTHHYTLISCELHAGCCLCLLQEFLKSEVSAENILFYQACERFKNIPPTKLDEVHVSFLISNF